MRWLPVVGYESLYEVSDEGHVFSRITDRMLLPDTSGAYFRVTLCRDNEQRRHSIHRLVLAAFVAPPKIGQTGNHRNGDKLNNRLDNLEYCTRSENSLHSYRILGNRAAHGQSHGRSRLTNEQAVKIYKLRLLGEPISDIAAMFGVCIATVSLIANGRTWKRVTEAVHPDTSRLPS